MGYSHPRDDESKEDSEKEHLPPLKMRRLESPEIDMKTEDNGHHLSDSKAFKQELFDLKHADVVKSDSMNGFVEKSMNGIDEKPKSEHISNTKTENLATEEGIKQERFEPLHCSSNTENDHEFSESHMCTSPSFDSEEKKIYPPTKDIIGDIIEEKVDEDIWKPMTFYPTYEEFKDLQKYVTYMESCGAHKCGIAKIVPPKEWVPRKQGYNPAEIDIELDHPVQQNISVSDIDGAFKTISDRSIPHFSVEKYMRLATNDKYITPAHNSYEELEELYWKQNLDDKLPAPIYGADVCDSITDPEETVWNIKKLDSLLTEVMEEQIPGVNMPYLYFGMWKATFSWHVEDMDLYGVNLLHYGAPKTWYCIPPQEGYKLEQVAQKLFPDMTSACYNLMRHKAIMISPKLLEANGLRVNKMIQEERNMIIVFPHAYHSGFNHGFNMAESTNFALPRWLEYGKRFRDCLCRGQLDEVSFSLDPFMKKCQPERLHAWRRGKDWDLHPEDPWFIKRCYLDATVRLDRGEITDNEFEKLKTNLRRKRQIPKWFKERFELDYADELDSLQQDDDMTDCIEIVNEGKLVLSPKIKSAKRKLLDAIDVGVENFYLKLKKLRKSTANIYLEEMQSYMNKRSEIEKEEEERKALVAAGKGDYSLGQGAARGVGFVGADVQDLLEKKSRVVCKAKKKHRFKACTKCTGCRQGNCGECEYCLDMPRFGGPGVIKQKCKDRVCVNPTVTTCDQCVWTI